MNRLIASIAPLLILTSCMSQEPSQQIPYQDQLSQEGRQISTLATQGLRVASENGQPLANAKVLIGTAQNVPMAQNFVTTATDGSFQPPQGWSAPLPVTIEAPGHIRTTFYDQSPGDVVFKIRTQLPELTRDVTGVTTNFDSFIKEKDGHVEFAFVMPLMTLEDFFFFTSSKIVSPDQDQISIMGKSVKFPSNISLPKQKEKYSLFSFTLDKHVYRMKVDPKAPAPLLALRGRASLKGLMDANNSQETINAVEFSGGGIRTLAAGDSKAKHDIPVNELSFSQKLEVVAPQMAADESMASMAIIEDTSQSLGEPHYFVSDVKYHASKEKRSLSTPPNLKPNLVFVWSKTESETNRGSSIMLQRNAQPSTSATRFLSMVPAPKVDQNKIILKTPKSNDGLAQLTTYLSLSEVKIEIVEKFKLEQVTRKWEFFVPSWSEQVEVPQWPEGDIMIETNLNESRYKRWEVLYTAKNLSENNLRDLETNDFSDVTHATRNYVDIAQ